MKLRIAIVDTFYRPHLESLGHFNWGDVRPEDADLELSRSSFGGGVEYSLILRQRGHVVEHIVANSLAAQKQHLAPPKGKFAAFMVRVNFKYWQHWSRIPVFGLMTFNRSPIMTSLGKRLRLFRPDVIYVEDINLMDTRMINSVARSGALVVGQIASPPPPKRFIRGYAHIFSAHPGLVEDFRTKRISSSWLPLGFNSSRYVDLIKPWNEREIPCVFVGSFGRLQKNTGPLLQEIKKLVPNLQIYGSADAKHLAKFGLLENYRGPAFGKEMFKVLGNSRISINRHGEIAGKFAVNMRMYESTGMGAVLLTEDRVNLKDLFSQEEVEAYGSNQDAAKKALALLSSPLAERMANRGHHATVTRHSYENRVDQILRTIEKLLSQR